MRASTWSSRDVRLSVQYRLELGNLQVLIHVLIHVLVHTGLIVVLVADPRWTAEGIGFDPEADDRPCPHDPAATDGTWWSPSEGVYVGHHKP